MVSKSFKVTVDTEEFDLMVRTLINVENSGLTLRVYKDRIEAFTMTQDSSSIIVYTCLRLVEPIKELEEGEEIELWIKTLDKFRKLLSQQLVYKRIVDKDNENRLKEEQKALGDLYVEHPLPNQYASFVFTVKDNYILHTSKLIRSAKFLLGEFPMRAEIMSRKVNEAWFNRFDVQAKFEMTNSDLKTILSNSDFAAGVEKVYIATEGDKIIFDINDKMKQSSDSIASEISTLLEGEILPDRYILPLASLGLITIHPSTPAIFMPSLMAGQPKESPNTPSVVMMSQEVGRYKVIYLLNGKKDKRD